MKSNLQHERELCTKAMNMLIEHFGKRNTTHFINSIQKNQFDDQLNQFLSTDNTAPHIFSPDEIKEIVTPIASEYEVNQLVLFGSYARGEATELSDIDIYIDIEPDWGGYFKLGALQNKLEDALGLHIDLLTTGSFDAEIFENVKGEAIVLYQQ